MLKKQTTILILNVTFRKLINSFKYSFIENYNLQLFSPEMMECCQQIQQLKSERLTLNEVGEKLKD